MASESRTTAADGVLETRPDGRSAIRFERRLDHPIERVWTALTDPRELIRWWGDAEVDLGAGRFKVRWLNTDEQGNSVVMDAKITALEPPTLLEMAGEPHGVLRWELRPDDDGTVLTFTSTVDLPDEFKTKVLAGWHYHLDALAETLGGGQAELVDLPNDGWERLHERYVTKLS